MKHPFFYLFIYISINLNAYSQIISKNQETTIKNTIRNQFGDATEDQNYNIGYNNIQTIGEDTLYNPDGYHYVFKLKNNDAIRLDKSTYHGANFNRFLFNWNGNLYALGGYGFFTTNNNLEFFNRQLKGWVYKNTKGNKPPYILGLTFKRKNKIYSFNNYKSGNTTTKDLLDSNLYVLDLEKMHWEKYTIKDDKQHFIGKSYYTKDYILYIGGTHSILLSPNKLKYISITNEDIGLRNNNILSINKNTLYLYNLSDSSMRYTKNLTQIWKDYKFKNSLTWEKFEYKKRNGNNEYLAWFSSLALILIFILYVKYYKIKTKQINEYSNLHLRFVNHPASKFSIEEIDSILEIEHLEIDSKKLKRTRLINEMNKTHPNFIEREKDTNDKRRYIYKINK